MRGFLTYWLIGCLVVAGPMSQARPEQIKHVEIAAAVAVWPALIIAGMIRGVSN